MKSAFNDDNADQMNCHVDLVRFRHPMQAHLLNGLQYGLSESVLWRLAQSVL
jgi:hypothetical protein